MNIITTIRRHPVDLISEFNKFSSATIHEAYDRQGYVDSSLSSIKKGNKICGSIFTVQCMPGDNLMLHKSLEMAQKGDVLAVSTEAYYNFGYWGELMTISAISKKIQAIVLDGCVRDTEEIIKLNFPVFSRGSCIKGTTKQEIGWINSPIVLGGLIVYPGDIIIGDDDGLVVVRYNDCKKVLQKAIVKMEKEEMKKKALVKGITSMEYDKLYLLFEEVD